MAPQTLQSKVRCCRPDLIRRLIIVLLFIGCLYVIGRLLIGLSPNKEFAPMSVNSVDIKSGECGTGYRDLIYLGESTDVLTPHMTDGKADVVFDRYMSKLHFICKNSTRLGNFLDGGWDMCLVGPYTPGNPCLVYSIGINNDFSFDDAVAKTYGCTVRSFDPSMSANEHKRSDKVWFYKTGLAGEDGINNKSWTVKTFKSLLQSFNEQDKTIDYFKLDIEWSEWPSLKSMLTTDVLSRVKQLAMEIHITVKKEATTEFLYDKYTILNDLEKAGFRRWHFSTNLYNLERRQNGFRSCCYEMIYINANYLPKWTPKLNNLN